MSESAAVPLPKKRGRPRLYTKVRVDASGNPIELTEKPVKRVELTDEQALALVKSRFAVMSRQVQNMANRSLRSLIVSGAPGVGKTYTIEDILARAAVKGEVKYEVVHGTMTAINLFRMLYRYRAPNCVLVLDDTDSVFTDEAAMNILKAAVDTSKQRRLSYLSDSFTGAELGGEEGDGESGDIPQQFVFEGSIIFITNLDFDAYLAAGSNRFSKHMEALMNRSLYLDLKIHGRRELSLWIGNVLRSARVLQVDYNLTDKSVSDILAYLSKHQAHVRSLSIRSALHCASLMNSEPETWRESADVLLLREKK